MRGDGGIPKLLGCAVAAACGCCRASAQDSVAQTPGLSDALSAYAQQTVRYVVDGVPVLSSWGHQFLVAPIVKASRGLDPFFESNLCGPALLSPDIDIPQSIAPASYSVWSVRGQGVNATANAPASTVQVSNLDRRFGVALTDFGLADSNVVGAIIGRRLLEPSRFYVARTVAASSRSSVAGVDTSVLAAGSVEALGSLRVRADSVGVPQTTTSIAGDLIARIDLPVRSSSVNAFVGNQGTGLTSATDAPATAIVFNAAQVSLAPPSAVPRTVVGGASGVTATLAFDGTFRRAGASTTAHLAPGIVAHRGNPSYATGPGLGGTGGIFGALGVSASGGGEVNAINLWSVDTTSQVVSAAAAVLPAELVDGAFHATEPVFTHCGSQTPFRGGGGQVAIGRNALGQILAAATARSDDAGEFIALTNFSSPGDDWTIVAAVNTPILNGPTGAQVGKVAAGALAGSAVTFSCPGMDTFGNVYFVCAFKPNLGPAGTAFIKAVPTPGGYRLERILGSGQTFTGLNSATSWQIVSLVLGDSDSIASGSFFASSVLQPKLPGPSAPSEPQAFGGAIVNAVIQYDNLATIETYDAALFVSANTISLQGDLNGDGSVNSIDLGQLLGSWGDIGGAGDLNGDGLVNSQDLAILLGNWG